MNKHRDWRFELLRIIAMFLIVATHFYAPEFTLVKVAYPLESCVTFHF